MVTVWYRLRGDAVDSAERHGAPGCCFNRGMARVFRTLLTAAAACVVLATASVPADATLGPGSPGGGGDVTAHPGAVRAQITFTKSSAHPWNSAIAWDARRQRADGSWRLVAHASWRAGSGLPGASTENACVKGHGWLPNGTYSLRQYEDYHGSLIHGRAFRLSDRRCSNGTLREQLFIHTEAGVGNSQCADAPGDQLCRWEYPKINDYTSHGCIKMSPAAILALTRDYHRYFKAGVRYPMARVRLVVR